MRRENFKQNFFVPNKAPSNISFEISYAAAPSSKTV